MRERRRCRAGGNLGRLLASSAKFGAACSPRPGCQGARRSRPRIPSAASTWVLDARRKMAHESQVGMGRMNCPQVSFASDAEKRYAGDVWRVNVLNPLRDVSPRNNVRPTLGGDIMVLRQPMVEAGAMGMVKGCKEKGKGGRRKRKSQPLMMPCWDRQSRVVMADDVAAGHTWALWSGVLAPSSPGADAGPRRCMYS